MSAIYEISKLRIKIGDWKGKYGRNMT
jgi:hypothetical protein